MIILQSLFFYDFFNFFFEIMGQDSTKVRFKRRTLGISFDFSMCGQGNEWALARVI